jgi:hypothetical protein
VTDVTLWWRRPPVPGSRRSARQRAVSQVRAQGRYGPTLRDVAPAFAGLVAALVAPFALAAVAYRWLGWPGLVLFGAVVLVVAVPAAAARRRARGRYTARELAGLDVQGLSLAAARFLRRDGWEVVVAPYQGRPRLWATRAGRVLDVTFREPSEPAEQEPGPAPLREAGRPAVDAIVRLVVSTGAYSRGDVLWASRQGGVVLLDGRGLRRWATGGPLGLPS